MKQKAFRINALSGLSLAIALTSTWPTQAQNSKPPYPAMAPIDQYLMEHNAEIAMAQSAAPQSISRDAEVMILGPHGYEIAVKGKNGFVCMVERSWMTQPDDPEFWNPKMRGPVCYNAPAAQFMVPLDIRKTESVLAKRSNTEVAADIKAAFDKKDIPELESGAMAYMLAKEGHLNDAAGHWQPHLMFLIPQTNAAAWGANIDGSPIFALDDKLDRYTLFLVPVAKWSDGTPAPSDAH
jgi:hypothetical protein